jgi:hypothetical protein
MSYQWNRNNDLLIWKCDAQSPRNWRWTTKVKAKTVTLSLSAEQADLFKEAIAANRRVESILNEMRSISQEVLLKSVPGTRKKSSCKIIPKGS